MELKMVKTEITTKKGTTRSLFVADHLAARANGGTLAETAAIYLNVARAVASATRYNATDEVRRAHDTAKFFAAQIIGGTNPAAAFELLLNGDNVFNECADLVQVAALAYTAVQSSPDMSRADYLAACALEARRAVNREYMRARRDAVLYTPLENFGENDADAFIIDILADPRDDIAVALDDCCAEIPRFSEIKNAAEHGAKTCREIAARISACIYPIGKTCVATTISRARKLIKERYPALLY